MGVYDEYQDVISKTGIRYNNAMHKFENTFIEVFDPDGNTIVCDRCDNDEIGIRMENKNKFVCPKCGRTWSKKELCEYIGGDYEE